MSTYNYFTINDTILFATMEEDSSDNESLFDLAPEVESTTFDVSLAAEHEYLGHDLEELSGRTVHDERSILSIPVMFELGIVLIPGQTLPLTVFYPPTIAMLRDAIRTDKTFGVICLKGASNVSIPEMSKIGTTAEIYQYSDDGDMAYFKLKARGRQRFKLLEVTRQTSGMLLGKVQILPEIDLQKPLMGARIDSLNRYRQSAKFKSKCLTMDSACVTWPRWTLQHYNSDCLSNKVIDFMLSLKLILTRESAPSDSTSLSYFAIQRIPVDDEEKIFLLSRHTAIERLQFILKLLAKFTTLFCLKCGNKLGDREDIFSMSVEGPNGTYCNPGGYVHEVFTLHQATGVEIEDSPPSTDHSWFPGYGWTIASCRQCFCHAGWLFTAMNEELHPVKFWGLTKRAITLIPAKRRPNINPSHVIQEFFNHAHFYV